ncbi:MAG: asparagine synthase C-terminal domain-containing protein [Acidimicrobiia bacterium]|nr:asparagine synthase C-terminal domain-containing protein [Acidimicrobiia bacterium]
MTTRSPLVGVEFTNRSARAIEAGDTVWFLLESDRAAPHEVERVISGQDDPTVLCRRHRNAALISLRLSAGVPVAVQAWRGLLATAEVYYAIRPEGELWISDHFKNVIAKIPPQDRPPNELGLAKHYLFRKPYGNTSYSAAVTRLGHGEHLTVDPTSGQVSTALFDRIDEPVVPRPAAEYVSLMDEALVQAMEAVPGDGSAAVMFSGGVDSSLMMSYLVGRAQPITFVPDTPEFGPETEYARNAARLIGQDIVEMPMVEVDFVEMMERATDVTARPLFDDAKPFLADTVLDSPFDHVIPGQGADSVLGSSLKLARFSSWFRWSPVYQTVSAASTRTSGHLGYRLRQVAGRAGGFRLEPLDPLGYAGTTLAHGDTSLFREVVGPDLVRKAHDSLLVYTTDRFDRRADPGSRFFSHIELAHWIVVFGNPVGTDRLVAQSCGKSITVPYLDPAVVQASATIPVEHRYVKRLAAKWILKELLSERVPGYPVHQRKKATALPWERFYRSGPLTKIWDRYDVPDIFEGKDRDNLIAVPTATTWNAISYAVWEQRIVRNDRLLGHPAAVAAQYPVGNATP